MPTDRPTLDTKLAELRAVLYDLSAFVAGLGFKPVHITEDSIRVGNWSTPGFTVRIGYTGMTLHLCVEVDTRVIQAREPAAVLAELERAAKVAHAAVLVENVVRSMGVGAPVEVPDAD